MAERFEQCAYAMEVTKQGFGIGGIEMRIIACCKNKKVGKGFLGMGGLEKITGFVDFSYNDENTESGVAYRIKSTDRCSSCRHFKQK